MSNTDICITKVRVHRFVVSNWLTGSKPDKASLLSLCWCLFWVRDITDYTKTFEAKITTRRIRVKPAFAGNLSFSSFSSETNRWKKYEIGVAWCTHLKLNDANLYWFWVIVSNHWLFITKILGTAQWILLMPEKSRDQIIA